MLKKQYKEKTILDVLRSIPKEYDLFPVEMQYYRSGVCECCGREIVYLDEKRSSTIFFLEDYRLDKNPCENEQMQDEHLPHLAFPDLYAKTVEDMKNFHFDYIRKKFFLSYVAEEFEHDDEISYVCCKCGYVRNR